MTPLTVALTVLGVFLPFILFALGNIANNFVRIVRRNILRDTRKALKENAIRYNLFRGVKYFRDKAWNEGWEQGSTIYRDIGITVDGFWEITDEALAEEAQRLERISNEYAMPHRWYRIERPHSIGKWGHIFATMSPTLQYLHESRGYYKVMKEQGYEEADEYRKTQRFFNLLQKFLEWVGKGYGLCSYRMIPINARNHHYRNHHYRNDPETFAESVQKILFLSQWYTRRTLHRTWSALSDLTYWLQVVLERRDRIERLVHLMANNKRHQIYRAQEWRKFHSEIESGVMNKGRTGSWAVVASYERDEFPQDDTWIQIPHGPHLHYMGDENDWEYHFIYLVLREELEKYGDYQEQGTVYSWLRLFQSSSRFHPSPVIEFLDDYADEGDWWQTAMEDDRKWDLECLQTIASVECMYPSFVDADKLDQYDVLTQSHSAAVLDNTSNKDIWAGNILTKFEIMDRMKGSPNHVESDFWQFEDEFDTEVKVWQYFVYVALDNASIYAEYHPPFYSEKDYIIGLALMGLLDEDEFQIEVQKDLAKTAIWENEQKVAKSEGRDANWRFRPSSSDWDNSIWTDIAEAKKQVREDKYSSDLWSELMDFPPFLPPEEVASFQARKLMSRLPGF